MAGIVIFGAGQTRACAAMAVREAGHAGPVRLIGDEPPEPHERPALSKQSLTGTAPLESARSFTRSEYAEKGIEPANGVAAVALAPSAGQVFLSVCSAVDYDRLLVTADRRVRPLPGVPEGMEGVFHPRTVADSLALGGAGARLRRLGRPRRHGARLSRGSRSAPGKAHDRAGRRARRRSRRTG